MNDQPFVMDEAVIFTILQRNFDLETELANLLERFTIAGRCTECGLYDLEGLQHGCDICVARDVLRGRNG